MYEQLGGWSTNAMADAEKLVKLCPQWPKVSPCTFHSPVVHLPLPAFGVLALPSIYHVKYSVRNSLDKHERFFVINGIYHVKYSVRNSLDKFIMSNTMSETALIHLNTFSLKI